MTLYLVRTEAHAVRWVPSKSVARRLVVQMKKAVPGIFFEEHDVPTKKPDLLEWLNKWNLEEYNEEK